MAPLEVPTRDGIVAGTRVSPSGGAAPVRSWKGIPYAAPPIGALRWRAPRPPQPWHGKRSAVAFSPDFPQPPLPPSRAPSTGEDCLYLNVWAPAAEPLQPLPVMVWVHGGGFVGGSGADARCDGARLAGQGVVVVTFNYRSGLFGFLAHPGLSAESAHGVSGNYGLLDQLQALQWVQDNIRGFGGDPGRVTVFGVSAGSASISLLLTSPLAEGLFQQAIMHSPGAARPLASLADAERAGLTLGSGIDALRRCAADEILAMTSRVSPRMRGLTTPRVLRPIHDGWVLPEDERAAFKAGRLRTMPAIVGTNADEGSLLTRSWTVNTLDAYRGLMEANFGSAVQQALQLYPARTDAEVAARTAELFGDTQFNYGARLLAQTLSRREPRTWAYLFARRRPHQPDGPHHGEEVGHVFGNLGADRDGEGARFDATDEAVSRAMMGAWVAFARTGDPNAPGLAAWPPYTQREERLLAFGDTVAVGRTRRIEQLDFLDGFYDRR